MSKVEILVVEDESIVALDIERRLKSLGYQVIGHVLSGEEAVVRADEERPDLVLMDIHLKGRMDGIEAAQKIRRLYDIPVIYITAYSDEATLERAKVTEPFGYILKPFQEREIHSAIEMAIYKHRAEQELRAAKEAAVEGYRIRSEFLANISHELRTPLNSILGMTQLARETNNDEERNDYLRMVKESGNHLLNLITSLLDFSKMEAGRIELVEEPFRLDELLESVVRDAWKESTPPRIDIYLDIDEKSEFSLRGDAARLRQILQNLIHNAVKFTAEGHVSIRARTETLKKIGKTLLQLSVADTGIGIPKKEKEEIFSMFYQIDNSLTRVHGGTGLGLAIVKNLVELMGGEINLESEEGKGSLFSITLPVLLDREDMRKAFSLPYRLKVHLISFDRKRGEIRKRQFEQWGAEVLTAYEGEHRGSSDDLWCIIGPCTMTVPLRDRLLGQGADEGRIILISPEKGDLKSKTERSVVFFEPTARRELFKAVKKAAEGGGGTEKALSCAVPRGEDETKRKSEKLLEKGQKEGGNLLAGDILSAFIASAEEFLTSENMEELEETALEVKQELEQIGTPEQKDGLFKIVLAGRKGNSGAIRDSLDYLKERIDENTHS